VSGDPSPQVLLRGDRYVIHNMDLTPYTHVQRAGVGIMVWDQVRVLMEASGEYRARDPKRLGSVGVGTTRDIDEKVAEMVGIKLSLFTQSRPRLIRRPDLVEKMLSGEITTMHDVQRAIGMKIRARLTEGAHSQADPKNVGQIGKGDKFEEAMEPLLRYLAAWKKRDFKYPHVPPRAAQKRIAVLDGAIADLQDARADLETRSHVATLSIRSEDKRRENR
jgi:hypothetical protein